MRGPQQPLGRRALEKKGGALKTTEAQVGKAWWEISPSANKAESCRLASPLAGKGNCSVNKLALALTAWKLILTPGKLQMTPFYQEQSAPLHQGISWPFLLLFGFVFSRKSK